MPKYKLIYFNGRGRAELTRLVFAQAGVEYQDCRITKEEWSKIKPDSPWGGVPLLEVDGKLIGQSIAIARFIAREYGLAGESPLEQCLVDSVVDQCVDIQQGILKVCFQEDPEKKAEMRQKVKDHCFPKLGFMEKFLSSNHEGDGFIVGEKVTWADLFVYNLMDKLINFAELPEPYKDFPKLDALANRVGLLPNIKKWVDSRPQTNF